MSVDPPVIVTVGNYTYTFTKLISTAEQKVGTEFSVPFTPSQEDVDNEVSCFLYVENEAARKSTSTRVVMRKQVLVGSDAQGIWQEEGSLEFLGNPADLSLPGLGFNGGVDANGHPLPTSDVGKTFRFVVENYRANPKVSLRIGTVVENPVP